MTLLTGTHFKVIHFEQTPIECIKKERNTICVCVCIYTYIHVTCIYVCVYTVDHIRTTIRSTTPLSLLLGPRVLDRSVGWIRKIQKCMEGRGWGYEE